MTLKHPNLVHERNIENESAVMLAFRLKLTPILQVQFKEILKLENDGIKFLVRSGINVECFDDFCDSIGRSLTNQEFVFAMQEAVVTKNHDLLSKLLEFIECNNDNFDDDCILNQMFKDDTDKSENTPLGYALKYFNTHESVLKLLTGTLKKIHCHQCWNDNLKKCVPVLIEFFGIHTAERCVYFLKKIFTIVVQILLLVDLSNFMSSNQFSL